MYTHKLNLCTKQLDYVHIFTSSSHSFPSLIIPRTPSEKNPDGNGRISIQPYVGKCIDYGMKGNRYIFRKITFFSLLLRGPQDYANN